jgi:hypothetical protein
MIGNKITLTLKQFCCAALIRLANDPAEEKAKLFCVIRYDEMNRLFPHRAFSISEATSDFFEKTLGYINDPESIPEIKPDTLEYTKNYLEWLHKYR